MQTRHMSRGPPRHGGGGGPRPPVKVGDELNVTIEAVGEKGDGIARKDGFVLFVPGVREGDQVKVKVTRVLRKVGFAEVVGSEGAAAPEDAEASEEEAADEGASEEAPAEETSEEEMPAEEATDEDLAPPEPPEEDSEDFGEEAPPEE